MAQATTSDANALLGLEKCLKGNRTITSRRRRRSPFARRLSSEMLLLGLSLELGAGRKSVRPACSTPQIMYPQSKREEAFDLRRQASSASLPPAAAASRALRFPPFRRSLPGSHSDPLRFVARRTRNVRRRRAEDESRRGVTSWAKHPPPESTFAKVIGGSRAITLFFPSFFRSHFFPLFQPLPTFFHSTGKVHGSLARAGKVRGQTPKVAKQDKKKLPKVSFLVLFPFLASLRRAPPYPPPRRRKTDAHPFFVTFLSLLLPSLPPPSPPQKNSINKLQGRAMKRIKYNRRFVNVVVGMGKKKSPNSQ